MKFIKIDVYGGIHAVKINGLRDMQKAVGGYIDIVPVNSGSDIRDLLMIVDDEGILKGKPINAVASYLYGFFEHGQPIFGDVLLCKPCQDECVGFEPNELDEMIRKLEAITEF